MIEHGATFRIGCGAGFSADRLDPAIDLARDGRLDVLVFECLGERTLAFGHRDRMADPSRGFNPLLARRMQAVLPLCRQHGTKIVTNMGVANPRAAAQATIAVARELGLSGLRVAFLEGDEVTDLLPPDTPLWEGGTLAQQPLRLVGANAYLGSEHLLPALATGAEVIITGRVADPALFLAPAAQHFGWRLDDWRVLGAGTLVGHLLECGMQVTGGYFADPGMKEVPELARCGYPIAEVAPDGSAVITKLAEAGGMVTVRTVKEQLLYEVHDPARYLTPDVTADFSSVRIDEQAKDRIAVSGAGGGRRPDRLKVTVGFDGGFLAEAGISYAGANAQGRAGLARDIVEERMRGVHGLQGRLRLDLIGQSSLHATATDYQTDSRDIRLHAALRSTRRDLAELLLWEIESLLCCGPAGGGGYRGQITPSVVTCSAGIDRALIRPSVEVLTA